MNLQAIEGMQIEGRFECLTTALYTPCDEVENQIGSRTKSASG